MFVHLPRMLVSADWLRAIGGLLNCTPSREIARHVLPVEPRQPHLSTRQGSWSLDSSPSQRGLGTSGQGVQSGQVPRGAKQGSIMCMRTDGILDGWAGRRRQVGEGGWFGAGRW